jgi:hypothetical protein
MIIEWLYNEVFRKKITYVIGIVSNFYFEYTAIARRYPLSQVFLIMRKLFNVLPLAVALLGCTTAFAQSNVSPAKSLALKKPRPINSELSGGLRLNTDGWSIFVDKGYVRTDETKLRDQFHNVRVFQLEFSEHKHPKEVKNAMTDQSSGGTQKTKPFIFGKINNFYSLKGGYGLRKMIAGKPEPGTVSIHWVGVAGFVLGMEKPYYLDGYIPQDNFGTLVPATFKYSDETKESFLNDQYIRGGAGFTKGIGEIQFVPGLHAKTALHFDFASSRRNVMAVETGISAEYYTRPIVLMANQDNKPYMLNLFASIQFGRRR